MGTALKFVTVIKDDATFRSLVLDAPKTCLCIVDCYSEIWGPCEALSKKLQSISTELIDYDVKFIRAQAESIELLSEQAGRSMPLFLLFKGGEEAGRIKGANPLQLSEMIREVATKRQSV
uniref:Thioredoxin domain-containing protein n=1 Tax=Chrysotila carterae TaxID=13221 RepID=A0A7S4BVI7_CHRCT|mmetsp:Transcript_58446/g.126941  ORF Transcript_58446/g.126941 Transcript_58446/m.126941 type:complete len:120 (+) Transcript_58446:302-661(+)